MDNNTSGNTKGGIGSTGMKESPQLADMPPSEQHRILSAAGTKFNAHPTEAEAIGFYSKDKDFPVAVLVDGRRFINPDATQADKDAVAGPLYDVLKAQGGSDAKWSGQGASSSRTEGRAEAGHSGR